MELYRLMNTILDSDPEWWTRIPSFGTDAGPAGDWLWREERQRDGSYERVPRSHTGRAFSRSDVNIGVAWGFRVWDDEERAENGSPEWAQKMLNPRAYPIYADVLWQGTAVFRELLWVVDGGRYFMADPEPEFTEETTGTNAPELTAWWVYEGSYRFATFIHQVSDPYGDMPPRHPYSMAEVEIRTGSRF